MSSKFLYASLAFVGMTGLCFGQDTTTVNWGNFSSNSGTQSSILFRDAAGNPLSQGVSNTNSDGTLVQLGYYSGAVDGNNNFTGNWTPITGFGSALPRTAIGDAFNNNGGGGNGSGAGVIDFTTFFISGEDQPFVYDPQFSGSYQTQSSVVITNTTPPNGIIMSIRFYDTINGLTGNFNAVSANSWVWQSPNTSGGGQVNISIATLFNDGPGGALADLEWFDPNNPFKTTVPIPEPSTYALLAFGAIGMMALRRRVKR